MPTELEELVGFIGHSNPTIRLTATEHLVPYSTANPAVFKVEDFKPIDTLKILTRDHPKISEHALTILVNLSADGDVLEKLATDDTFVRVVLIRVAHPEEQNANLFAMLLANLSKWDDLKSIIDRKQTPQEKLGSSDVVMDQLMDLFVKGSDGSYNKHANYDYLSYVFADLSKHAKVREYFVSKQSYDDAVPITKLKVFTEHKSDVRRKGVASTIKNVAFDKHSHPKFFDEEDIDILPYILLPLTGNEEYDDEESEAMLEDLQLLPPDKQRDSDPDIIQTHLETLLLMTTTRPGRELMRRIQVYPIIRETHKRVNHEGVTEACDRLVQVLMRDEAEPAEDKLIEGAPAKVESEDEENELVEV
ncbi:hypothetical protein MKZ38_009411 [Zalerion maritima]|uniref:Protein HGH1 homolog n=1 Tax=Zalerion maritima TaxID=339359 RepID=A0AAD5WT03_9PEZI|nr:hypothetical protein MKZ38_009411 [Zalerion maritima]